MFSDNQSFVLRWYPSKDLDSVTKEIVCFLRNEVVVDRIDCVIILGVFKIVDSVPSFTYLSVFLSRKFDHVDGVVSFVILTSLDYNDLLVTVNDSCCKGCLDSEVNVVSRNDFCDYSRFRKCTQSRSCILFEFVDKSHNSRNRSVSKKLLSVRICVHSHFISTDFFESESDTPKTWKWQLFNEIVETLELKFWVIVDHFGTSFDVNEISFTLSIFEHHRHWLKLGFVLIYFEYFKSSTVYAYFPHNIATSAFVERSVDEVKESQIYFIAFDLTVDELDWVATRETIQNIVDFIDFISDFCDFSFWLKVVNFCDFHSVLGECSCFIETKSF